MSSDTRSEPDRDLDIALSAAAELNRVIAAADAKIGLVLAGQSVVLAGAGSALRVGAPPTVAVQVCAVLALVLASGAVVLLAAALWPRTYGHGPIGPVDRATAGATGRARDRADVLAAIVRHKYRWFRPALAGGTAALLTFATALVLGVTV